MPGRWALLLLGGAASGAEWTDWLARFGHDDYVYPWWISSQILACNCTASPARCVLADARGGAQRVDWRAAVADDAARRSARGASADGALTYCIGKAWLLEHMPPFDLAYLPPAVTVNATSMLDDTLAFALMADRAARWSYTVPLEVKLAYLLPYASYHESRQNWRPLLFAKFFPLVADAPDVVTAIGRSAEIRPRCARDAPEIGRLDGRGTGSAVSHTHLTDISSGS